MRITTLGLLALFACGGGAADSSGPNSPQTSSDGGAAPANGGADAKDAGAPSTTLVLGDGGELQGTKLTQSGTMAMPTSANDGGAPAGGGKVDEPGRRPEDIQTIVGNHRAEARACYDAARKTNPSIGDANMMFEWVVDPKGNVTRADVVASKSNFSDAAVVACIGKVLKSIKWAEHTKSLETTMHYQFNFKKNSAQATKP